MKFAPIISVIIFGAFASPTLAQDSIAGKKIFKKCAACHRIGDGARNGAGPVLTTVVGRRAGTFEGFGYSKSFRNLAKMDFVWDQEKIAEYIKNPTAYLRKILEDPRAKAKMRFKLKDEQARLDVAAYLASFQTSDMQTLQNPPSDTAQTILVTPGQICVTNAAKIEHLFAVEAATGIRVVKMLAPNTTLCTASSQGGKVSVFESADGFEGCTRLVAPNQSEIMFEYAEFDRCAWAANSN